MTSSAPSFRRFPTAAAARVRDSPCRACRARSGSRRVVYGRVRPFQESGDQEDQKSGIEWMASGIIARCHKEIGKKALLGNELQSNSVDCAGRRLEHDRRRTRCRRPQGSHRFRAAACAADTKPASNADGAKYTPASSIAWKKRLNRAVSHAITCAYDAGTAGESTGRTFRRSPVRRTRRRGAARRRQGHR